MKLAIILGVLFSTILAFGDGSVYCGSVGFVDSDTACQSALEAQERGSPSVSAPVSSSWVQYDPEPVYEYHEPDYHESESEPEPLSNSKICLNDFKEFMAIINSSDLNIDTVTIEITLAYEDLPEVSSYGDIWYIHNEQIVRCEFAIDLLDEE